MNIIIKGFIRPGMKAVTSSMEHNSVLRPLRRAERDGTGLEIIQCSMKGYLDPATLKKAFSQGADIAIINHCSNVSGSLQNIADIAEVCRGSGVPSYRLCPDRRNCQDKRRAWAAAVATGHRGFST
ncbi:MAG: aminotransferase class V-fold PLP-dependent enzyme [Bacteroidales bacterium]|nr:aminotransferase class V-fold PLP-dependent enzyme [Bacteroidales bacterium]